MLVAEASLSAHLLYGHARMIPRAVHINRRAAISRTVGLENHTEALSFIINDIRRNMIAKGKGSWVLSRETEFIRAALTPCRPGVNNGDQTRAKLTPEATMHDIVSMTRFA